MGFTISEWKDLQGRTHDNYDCDDCQYSTLEMERMEKHLATATGPKGHGHAWAKPGANIAPARSVSQPLEG